MMQFLIKSEKLSEEDYQSLEHLIQNRKEKRQPTENVERARRRALSQQTKKEELRWANSFIG